MTARFLVADLERIPMFTKPMPVWDMKGLMNRRLTPGDIDSWGRTICLAYSWWGESKVHFISEWGLGREGYLLAVKGLMEEADILGGHNSEAFDFKHLAGDLMMELGVAIPKIKHIDTLKMARKNANWEANHLDTLTRRLGIPAKTDKYRIDVAVAAVNGDAKAQRRIELYNKGDVRASKGLIKKFIPWSDVNLGLFNDDPTVPVCPGCNGKNFQRRGYAVKQALRYPRLQCQSCGKWQTSKHAEPGSVAMRPL